MQNDLTPHLTLPLPHPDNDLEDDVLRLRDALSAIDTAINTKADAADISTAVSAAVAALVAAAPGTLDTLNEIAASLGDDANFAATMTAALGNRLRVDIDNQNLTTQQKANAATNLGLLLAVAGGSSGLLSGADKAKLDAISGSNTGDQTLASLNAQELLVAGLNIKTINGVSPLGIGNIIVGTGYATALKFQ